MRAWNLSVVAATLLLSGGVAAALPPADNDCEGENCNGAAGDGQGGLNGLGGADGLNGANGLNGLGGADGLSGANGANGLGGADGLSGANGQDGQHGENGGDGRDGRDGLAFRVPVATAYAAPILAVEDTCMGSSSMGAQSMSFGVSIGATWQDDNCRRLKNARQLAAMGYRRAAVALLCVDDEVRTAMAVAGTPCPGGQPTASDDFESATPAREPAPPADQHPNRYSVLFDFDSATLKPQSVPALEQLLAALQTRAAVSVEITGFADATGEDAYNLSLSRRRGQAVADWLIARGVDPTGVRVEGKGETEPVARNETAAGRALNRRVEVSLR